jgi:restriction system protein
MTHADRTILDHIEALDGPGFERFLCDVFSRLGYTVEQTEFYDRAADLILVGDRGRIAVKAKRLQDPVPERAVQAAVAAKAVYGCEHALVVTNSTFTPGARRLARANHVGLWSRDRLLSESVSARRA